MSAPSLLNTRRRIRSTSQLSIASVFTLAQIDRWGLHAWQPRTPQRPPFAILADPAHTSLNPRTVTMLLSAGMVETVDDALVLTELGRRTVLENSDLYPSDDTPRHGAATS
ncbi:hypothetical protein FVA74_01265 [Salinibacterium sp. dk2585]|uniref:hypothetical protein n=1 Tax=unclassified Salinibacterium TaxID=2632331 RepID=UPI0011C2567C|nr:MULTISPECIES: hypothetical protein [unclassified Salinibacterium]QEE60346.1 hypothetical protein FVA74_01265 [Salinibacterium sp. dk2585]TXK55419.1 hypothetical protein FVP63_01410 [Salinibacterium sp. dk5596]